MKQEEFNLSEKIWIDKCGCKQINIDNVKEFIRLLRESYIIHHSDDYWLIEFVDKLAGDKLK